MFRNRIILKAHDLTIFNEFLESSQDVYSEIACTEAKETCIKNMCIMQYSDCAELENLSIYKKYNRDCIIDEIEFMFDTSIKCFQTAIRLTKLFPEIEAKCMFCSQELREAGYAYVNQGKITFTRQYEKYMHESIYESFAEPVLIPKANNITI